MIITCSSHGRTERDCRNLVRHLENRKDNETVLLVEIGNSIATTLGQVVEDMQTLRDGSSAQVSLHHVTINPSSYCDATSLQKVAAIVRAELDPDSSRPYALVMHSKNRLGKQNSAGRNHAHLVLGHVDFEGRALKDGRSKQRLEFAARVAEHFLSVQLGQKDERPVLGRHFAYTLNRMLKDAPSAAEWHKAHFGANPDKPLSSMSTATRQRASREGLRLPAARAEIVAIWETKEDLADFFLKLREAGYCVEPGQRDGVFVVVDVQSRMVGALDRILKLKRQEIKQLLEYDHVRQFVGKNVIELNAIRPAFGADRRAGSNASPVNGGGPYRKDSPVSGSMGWSGHAAKRSDAANERQTRRSTGYSVGLTLARLRKLGLKLSTNPLFSANHLSQLHAVDSWLWNGAVDIWGIPIEPPKTYIPR